MPRCRFSLHIDRQQFLRYYQGQVQQILVTTEEGPRVQFPAAHLRPFLSERGIQGRFALYYDEGGKFVRLERIA
ncbi:MAG: DUF2835 domain-containing protein [Desulfuromonadales bacterium]|uniref:DUF2835 domain-containing protein n=1 Tax=Desulfuromonas sp. KJ2020 TaxID=2919173 RepID=UPI00032397CC|nr:DUF2835 domain-containing protein [Desulfuromonas sp. KJ2020]MCP3175806.1 DUF2835 domain-containing protein [Desulfuromonas sp. KJ2020]